MGEGAVRQRPARDRLLKAAADLFYAHGIAATGIDAITEQAGVAKKSLYNNFASKDELVLTYLTERHQEWLELHRLRAAEARTARDRVLAVFDAYIDHAEAAYTHGFRGCGLLNAAAELPAGAPGRAAVREHKEQVEAILAAVAGRGPRRRTGRGPRRGTVIPARRRRGPRRTGRNIRPPGSRPDHRRRTGGCRVGGRGMNRGRMLAIGAITITSILWGTTGTAATFAPDAGPLAIGAAALGIGGILQALIAIPALLANRGRLRANLPLVAVGAVAVAIYPLAFYSSMHLAGVALGTVVSLASAPLASGVLEWFVQRTPLGRWWMVAAGLGIIGSVLLCLSKMADRPR